MYNTTHNSIDRIFVQKKVFSIEKAKRIQDNDESLNLQYEHDGIPFYYRKDEESIAEFLISQLQTPTMSTLTLQDSPNMFNSDSQEDFDIPPVAIPIEIFSLSDISISSPSPKNTILWDDTEILPQKIIRRKTTKNSSYLSAKKKQNKMKNFQGLISQRIKTLSKNSEFYWEVVKAERLFLDQQDEFKKFLSGYDKNFKTWKTITQYLQTNPKFAKGFLKLVYAFLSPEYSTEFEKWLKRGRMNNQNKETLSNNITKVLAKFRKLEGSLYFEEDLDFGYPANCVKKLKIR